MRSVKGPGRSFAQRGWWLAAARSPGAEPSRREASWPGRHEGESHVLKAWGMGEQELGKVLVLQTPQCDKTLSLLGHRSPSYPSPLHLLQLVGVWASMGDLDLRRFIGPVLRWSDVKEPRLSCLWVKRAFTLAEPRLDWGAVVRGHGLVRLDMLNILGNVMLGALGLRLLPVTLQGAVVMLQLNAPGMKMFIFLGHLGDTSSEALYLCLEIAERGVKKRRRGLIGEGANWAGQLREQWIVFSSGEGEDLRQGASLQKIKWEKQSLNFGHRCGAGQRLSNA
ncbi:unnamed protein product [Prunus armeniaca]